MYCTECGKQLPDISKYCYYCGCLLNEKSHPASDISTAEIEVSSSAYEDRVKVLGIMLESGNFKKVEDSCLELLDEAPKDGRLYLYLLLASLKCTSTEKLKGRQYFDHPYFQKAFYYADDSLKQKLKEYHCGNNHTLDRKKLDRLIERLSGLYYGAEFEFGYQTMFESIVWEVLGRQGNFILAETKKAVGWWPFGVSGMWLENIFYNHWFTEEEKRVVYSLNGSHFFERSQFPLLENLLGELNSEMQSAKRELSERGYTSYMILIDLAPSGKEPEKTFFEPYSVCNWERFFSLRKGSIFTYGRYEGKEIEWIVLRLAPDVLKAVARFPLCKKPFHSAYARTDWERCSLNEWLNGDFWESAFTKQERMAIAAPITIPESKEVKEYLSSKQLRCTGTYWWVSKNDVCFGLSEQAAGMNPDGEMENKVDVDCDYYYVRPIIQLISNTHEINDFIRKG